MGNQCSRKWDQQTQAQGWFFFIERVKFNAWRDSDPCKAVLKVTHMNPCDDFQGLARNHCLPKLTLDFAQPNTTPQVLFKTFGTQYTTGFFLFKEVNNDK